MKSHLVQEETLEVENTLIETEMSWADDWRERERDIELKNTFRNITLSIKDNDSQQYHIHEYFWLSFKLGWWCDMRRIIMVRPVPNDVLVSTTWSRGRQAPREAGPKTLSHLKMSRKMMITHPDIVWMRGFNHRQNITNFQTCYCL